MSCSLPGSSVHGISQARIREWVTISSPEDLPNWWIKPASPALPADSLPLNLGSPLYIIKPESKLSSSARWKAMGVKSGIQISLDLPTVQHSAWPKVDLETAGGQREGQAHKLLVCSNVHSICKGYIGTISMRVKGIFFLTQQQLKGIIIKWALSQGHTILQYKQVSQCNTPH